MKHSIALVLCVSVVGLACGASAPPPPSADSSAPAAPFVPPLVAPGATAGSQGFDRAAFDRFVATHPTQAAFEAKYPHVDLIVPGVMTTDEMRPCCGRYFPVLDDHGNITGGSFH